MPRPAKSRTDRTADVCAAIASLAALVQRAQAAERKNGPTDPATLAAWEAVEINGATVHRQSRILAGKSRGG